MFPDCTHDLSGAGLFGVGALDEKQHPCFAWKATAHPGRGAPRSRSATGSAPDSWRLKLRQSQHDWGQVWNGTGGSVLTADAAHTAAVLQVKATLRARRLRHPAAQRSAEQRQGFVHLDEEVLVDLVGL